MKKIGGYLIGAALAAVLTITLAIDETEATTGQIVLIYAYDDVSCTVMQVLYAGSSLASVCSLARADGKISYEQRGVSGCHAL